MCTAVVHATAAGMRIQAAPELRREVCVSVSRKLTNFRRWLMAIKTMQDLVVHTLRDIYYVEKNWWRNCPEWRKKHPIRN